MGRGRRRKACQGGRPKWRLDFLTSVWRRPTERCATRARQSWESNARFWDERMGEGNDFVNMLEWPAIERLLQPRKGERLLDIACGNGLTSRRLARTGADGLAFDFSETMIAIARERTGEPVDYRVIDATDRQALLSLGEGSFDGALCNMGLMDMADIRPLMDSLAVLLRPQGRFVLSVMHPVLQQPIQYHDGRGGGPGRHCRHDLFREDVEVLDLFHTVGRGHTRTAGPASLFPPVFVHPVRCCVQSRVCAGRHRRARVLS